MDPIIKQTIDGMLSSFAHVQVSDPTLIAEIETYKQDMYALGQRSGDVGSFMTGLQSSGLMEKQSELITRASMAQAPEPSGQQPGQAASSPPTVSEFLEQYRPGFDAAKAHGFQYTAVTAYEQLFAVAGRTEDMLTMQVMLEQEGHLRALSSNALYDINKLHFDATDPNNLGVRAQHHALMELAQGYRTDEELYYQTDLLVQQNQQGSVRHHFLIEVAAQLSLACVAYGMSKGRARMSLSKYAGEFVAARDAVRNTYQTIGELFGLDFDAILANPWLKHWLLNPSNLESTGRVTKCLDLRNLDYMREVIFQEVLSPLTDLQCLERLGECPFYPSLNLEHDPEQRQADAAIGEAGKQRLQGKYYAGYETKVKVPGASESP